MPVSLQACMPQVLRTALLLLMLIPFWGVFPGASVTIADEGPVIYVVPAITNERILPDTILSESLISNEITITAAPGEHEPASFVLRAPRDISGLRVEPTDLVSPDGSLSPEVIDIRAVKCWYQAGDSKFKEGIKVLMPELLLKDDALVRVENGENYLKVGNQYLWISSPDGTIPGIRWMPTPDQMPVRDATTLQPVDIPAGTNKQFWITARVPLDAPPGTYTGRIVLTEGQTPVGGITIRLRVLPFTLAEPLLTYSMCYEGQLRASGEGSISSRWKTETQLRAEFKDLLEHGVTNPVVFQSLDDLELLRRYLRIMRESGLSTSPLFLRPGDMDVADANLGFGTPSDPKELVELERRVAEIIALAGAEGYSEVYFYGVCEALGYHQSPELLTAQRPAWEAIHRAGGKVFDSGVPVGLYSDERQPGNFGFVGDIQDLLNCNGVPSAEEAARWHSMGHKIFCYSNPQAGVEKPETYRRNYGLLLWQADYDGAMPYAYQVGRVGNIWNDWRKAEDDHRNRAMAYPTADGVIDTLQWEGWREGVDDVRYLTTLLEAIETARAQGKDTSSAEAFIAGLKQTNLGTVDLNAVRAQIVGHILRLQGYDVAIDASTTSLSSVSHRSDVSSPLSISLKDLTDSSTTSLASKPIETGIVIESAVPAAAFIDINESLVGWWRFEGESDLEDHSTYSNDATDRGTAYVPEGRFGGGRSFSGNGDLKCASAESLNGADGLTIEMWVKPEGGTTDFPRFLDRSSAYYVAWRLAGGPYRHPFFVIYSGGKSYSRYWNTALPSSDFTHLVAVYDASTGRMDCYTNGVLDNGDTAGLPPPGSKIDASGSNLRIGTNYVGTLDEVRIWNRALSAAEVRALYDVRAVNTPFEIASLGPGIHRYSAYAVDVTGKIARTEMQSVTLKSDEYLAFAFLPQTPQMNTSSGMINASPQPDFIAWSPYGSPENPGDLGIYLMGKGSSEGDLAVSVGVPMPERQNEIAAPAAQKDSLWPFAGRKVAYLVAAVAGVSALLLWVYRHRKRSVLNV